MYLMTVLLLIQKNLVAAINYTCHEIREKNQRIHIVEVDTIELESLRISKAAGDFCAREELSVMGPRHEPTVAIPVGEFRRGGRFNGSCLSALIIDSYPYADLGLIRPLVVVDGIKKEIKFHSEKIKWVVDVSGQVIPLDGVNSPAFDDQVIGYNRFFGSETCSSVNGIELVIERGKLSQVRNFWGSGAIPSQGYVVRIGRFHPLIQFDWRSCLNKPCSVRIQAENFDLERDAVYAVQGQLVLLQDGEVNSDFENQLLQGGIPVLLADEIGIDLTDGVKRSAFINKSDARIGIGFTPENKCKIIVVEGGAASTYTGFSVTDLADFMKQSGCLSGTLIASGAAVGLWFKDRLVTAIGGCDHIPGREEELPIAAALLLFEK